MRDATTPTSLPCLSRLRGGVHTPPPLNELGPLSTLPPLVALAASVATKQVILALLLAVWTGAALTQQGGRARALRATLRTFDKYLLDALADRDHAAVVLFTFLLGGTIGIVAKSGGGQGLAKLLSRFMTSATSAVRVAFALCSLVFFDDYSSILVVGNSLSPAMPALGVPPERLALIVHIMGVSLASLSPVSSWIGLQIGYVADLFRQLDVDYDPFVFAMRTVPYRFLPLLLLAVLALTMITQRDIGPMARVAAPSSRAAVRGKPAAATAAAAPPGPLEPNPGTDLRAINALLPFGTIVVSTFAGMLMDGASKIRAMPLEARPPLTLMRMLGECDSLRALVWSSAAGWLVSLSLVLAQKTLSCAEAMEAFVEGIKDVVEPTLVLLLAWALGAVISDVGTASFLSSALDAGMPRWALPSIVALLAHAVSYACGSSFGTMGILLPLIGPLAFSLGGGDVPYLQHCVAAVLGGATFGNICSPISDTTVLTVLSTKCALPSHVGTITPYVVLAAATGLALCSLPVALGLYGPWVALGLSVAALWAVLVLAGSKPQA